ncbi:hypothetical protein Poli38472_004327 [Pythium oligandrum]|uniref:Galactokinase n=1 Tax=Pythium oligandrum TaxID=41045 RepID=A0A8K1CAR4_PYTOL|nr:hypothetical protein Poli38472_004327 [Pythium oligandrum]|eukprot:TMW59258.1 hypothetical protein Poli38472_004327 [Pythium oligandrum]
MTTNSAFDAVVEEAVALFYATFAKEADMPRSALTIAAAPGRVNLIGEHTDYNDGFVLPLALDKYTVVVGIAAPSSDNEKGPVSKVISTKFSEQYLEFPADASLHPDAPRSWANYVKGVTATYLEHTKRAALPVRAAIASNVPVGGGLSSSAAVEVAFATFLEAVYDIKDISKKQKALLCQKAEHTYCNVPCGIMDQFISTCGQRGAALLIDCRTKEATPVEFHDPDVVIVVSNSNVQHELSGSEYKDRVQQCKDAVKGLQTKYPEVTHLRDATMEQLEAVRAELSDVVFARARHVITENERTTATMELINSRKYAEAGQHMFASHASLRDDYQVSTPQLDVLVEMARSSPGVFGARMTGGGFGGCIVVLMQSQHAPALLEKLGQGYPKDIFGDHSFPTPTSFITTIGSGAHVIQGAHSTL